MPWPWTLPVYLAVPYWVGFALLWRSMAGHVAWEVHRSAKTNTTLRPPVENWIASAVACIPLALVWFVTLLFVIRWPRRLTRGAEREAEVELRGLRLAQLEADNENDYRRLNVGVDELEVLD